MRSGLVEELGAGIVPHSRSAKKSLRQSETRRIRNRSARTGVRTSVKKAEESISSGDSEQANVLLKQAIRELDGAVTKGLIHQNTVARKKSRLTKRLNALQGDTS